MVGKLSHWIQQAIGKTDSVQYILVDRENCRRKVIFFFITSFMHHVLPRQMDLYHRFDEQGPKFERLLIDIEHLDIGNIIFLYS